MKISESYAIQKLYETAKHLSANAKTNDWQTYTISSPDLVSLRAALFLLEQDTPINLAAFAKGALTVPAPMFSSILPVDARQPKG
jgi:hypothetical protein